MLPKEYADAIDYLQRMLDLFDGGEHWIQDNWAIDADHQNVGDLDPTATCFCLQGAMARVVGYDRNGGSTLNAQNAYRFLDRAISVQAYEWDYHERSSEASITDWNDNSDRTWDEVEKLIEDTISYLRTGADLFVYEDDPDDDCDLSFLDDDKDEQATAKEGFV